MTDLDMFFSNEEQKRSFINAFRESEEEIKVIVKDMVVNTPYTGEDLYEVWNEIKPSFQGEEKPSLQTIHFLLKQLALNGVSGAYAGLRLRYYFEFGFEPLIQQYLKEV